MNFSRYNAEDTVITVDGVHITGFGEEFWSFEKQEALAEDEVGALGDVCRNEINNDLHDATITVQKTSPQAKFLRSLKDRKEPFSIWCFNKALGIREGGTMALVNEKASSTLGKTAGESEFKFIVYDGKSIDE